MRAIYFRSFLEKCVVFPYSKAFCTPSVATTACLKINFDSGRASRIQKTCEGHDIEKGGVLCRGSVAFF